MARTPVGNCGLEVAQLVCAIDESRDVGLSQAIGDWVGHGGLAGRVAAGKPRSSQLATDTGRVEDASDVSSGKKWTGFRRQDAHGPDMRDVGDMFLDLVLHIAERSVAPLYLPTSPRHTVRLVKPQHVLCTDFLNEGVAQAPTARVGSWLALLPQ